MGRGRQHVPANMQDVMLLQEWNKQQCTRSFGKQTGCTWSPLCCLLRLGSLDRLRFPLRLLSLPTVTRRKRGNGDDISLPLSDQDHRVALTTLPLAELQQVHLPTTSAEPENPLRVPGPHGRRSVCCIPLPWMKPPRFPSPEITQERVRMTHLCVHSHAYSHTQTQLAS